MDKVRLTSDVMDATKPLGTSAQNSAKIWLTQTRATCKDAGSAANADGRVMGTVKIAFDKGYIESLNGLVIFIDWNGAPTQKGWHKVDRTSRSLVPISANDINDLAWSDRIYVHEDALRTAKEKRPLRLYIGFGARLILDGDYDEQTKLLVAQVEPGHEAAAPQTPVGLRE
jgi:hypothetical protein